ncbi:MAG: hypothetical protein ACRDH8_12065 [Actinomycetota bacterium]
MAGLAGQALAVGGTAAAVTAFAVAGLAIVLLASASALTVALAQERLGGRLEAAGPTMKRWGGWILVVVGGWFVALGVFADFIARVFPV